MCRILSTGHQTNLTGRWKGTSVSAGSQRVCGNSWYYNVWPFLWTVYWMVTNIWINCKIIEIPHLRLCTHIITNFRYRTLHYGISKAHHITHNMYVNITILCFPTDGFADEDFCSGVLKLLFYLILLDSFRGDTLSQKFASTDVKVIDEPKEKIRPKLLRLTLIPLLMFCKSVNITLHIAKRWMARNKST